MKQQQNSNQKLPHVVVIGAGIGGIKSALDLARTNHKVTLIDQSAAIGGVLLQLDTQFPNNHCGICRMLPMTEREIGTEFCLRKGILDQNIQVRANVTVKEIQGSAGNYQLSLEKKSTGIDPKKCLSCNECLNACKESRVDSFNEALSQQKAIYYPQPYLTPAIPVIDDKNCSKCGDCQVVCPSGAIHLDFKETALQVEDVTAIIVATGFEAYNPDDQDIYATKTLKNVVTGIQFERLISSSYFSQPKPTKPSNGQKIKKIAWVQCVGSRNLTINADYCSNACCMMAIKETMLATKKLGSDVQKDIYYMDMRTFGRDFQQYKDLAEQDPYTNFIRCRIHSIEPKETPDNLAIQFVDENGQQQINDYDLVVLSTGQTNNPLIQETVFDKADQEGIFKLSPQQQLTDISETVLRSLATVSDVQRLTVDNIVFEATDNNSDLLLSHFLTRPQIAVLICDDNFRTMDMQSWQSTINACGNLSMIEDLHILEKPSLTEIENYLSKITTANQFNRVLIGFSNPVLLNQWQQILTQHPSKYKGVPIHSLDLSHYASPSNPEKGKNLNSEIQRTILTGLQSLSTLKKPTSASININQSALVIGGGPTGLKTAETLAEKGIDVTLLEKKADLGGNINYINQPETRAVITKLIEQVHQNPRVNILTDSELINTNGNAGQFRSMIRKGDQKTEVSHGATIIATGGEAIAASGYDFGSSDAIITHNDLEKRLIKNEFKESVKTVVLIQCVGSRAGTHNYCSKTCCIKNIQNAIRICEKYSETTVYVFFRDIMTYGDNEKLYTKARSLGVIFIPFHKEQEPTVKINNNQITVTGYDPIMGCDAIIETDLIVLATGIQPYLQPELIKNLKLKTGLANFIIEADYKWRPVDTFSPGVFVAGLARNPVNTEDAIKEGSAAAERAYQLLQKPVLKSSGNTAQVNHFLCSACQLCIQDCPYQARSFDIETNVAKVDILSCQGCGSCAVICPNSASHLSNSDDASILNSIETQLSE